MTNHTKSQNYLVYPNGNRGHTDDSSPATLLTDGDINQLTWEAIELIKAGGQTPVDFNPNDPNTYKQVEAAVKALINSKANELSESIGSVAQTVAENFLATAAERSYFRLTKNQRMIVTTGSVPDYWGQHNDVTVSVVEQVTGNEPWANRSAVEKELLIAMDQENANLLHGENQSSTGVSFNIMSLAWTNSPPLTLYQYVAGNSWFTSCCWSKLVSGSVNSGNYMTAGITDSWSLTGTTHFKKSLSYAQSHVVIPDSSSGEILFALPATVAGKFPIETSQWGKFPYIGDQQYN